jgi:hypothetical protein
VWAIISDDALFALTFFPVCTKLSWIEIASKKNLPTSSSQKGFKMSCMQLYPEKLQLQIEFFIFIVELILSIQLFIHFMPISFLGSETNRCLSYFEKLLISLHSILFSAFLLFFVHPTSQILLSLHTSQISTSKSFMIEIIHFMGWLWESLVLHVIALISLHSPLFCKLSKRKKTLFGYLSVRSFHRAFVSPQCEVGWMIIMMKK